MAKNGLRVFDSDMHVFEPVDSQRGAEGVGDQAILDFRFWIFDCSTELILSSSTPLRIDSVEGLRTDLARVSWIVFVIRVRPSTSTRDEHEFHAKAQGALGQ